MGVRRSSIKGSEDIRGRDAYARHPRLPSELGRGGGEGVVVECRDAMVDQTVEKLIPVKIVGGWGRAGHRLAESDSSRVLNDSGSG